MKNSVNTAYKNNPVLLDRIIQDLRKAQLEKLPWLDYAFGRAYKLVEHLPGGAKFIYPAVYTGKEEYLSVLPNDNLGNFSWFDIYDPQDIIQVAQGRPKFTVKGSLIFWYNQKSVYNDSEFIYAEEIKKDIMRLFSTPGIISGAGRIEILRIYESFESIYQGYSLEKIYSSYGYADDDIQALDKQYFMYPFAGLRLEFKITAQELC